MRRLLIAGMLAALVLGGPLSPIGAADAGKTTAATPAAKASLAERTTQLQQRIESDRKHLEDLRGKLEVQEKEFQEAGEEFRQLQERQEAVESGKAGPTSPDALADLREKHRLARERFDVAIRSRKTTQGQIAALEEKIARDQEALDAMLGPDEGDPAVPAPSEKPMPRAAKDAAAGEAPEGREAAPPSKEGEAASPRSKPAAQAAVPPSEEVQEAREEAASRLAEAAKAKQHVERIEGRLEWLDRNIDLERQARDDAASRVENAESMLRLLEEDLEEARRGSAAPDALESLQKDIRDARQRLDEGRSELRRAAGHLDELQTERTELLRDRIQALEEAQEKQRQAEEARQRVEALESPFAWKNVVSWLVNDGPVVLLILIGILVGRWLVRAGARRSARLLAQAGGQGSLEERERRAELLATWIAKVGSFLVVIAGVLLILHELRIPVAPLWTMVSAVLAMVAIGFVAVWSILSNTLCSLMLLIFQPFKAGSTIELVGTEVRGRVVNFNLMYTTLRTDDGDAIEVPNNAFFQQPIRHREGRKCVDLDEQLTRVKDAE